MLNNTSHLKHNSCLPKLTPLDKVVIVTAIVGIALSILAVSAFLVSFPQPISFFNNSVVEIALATTGGTFIIGSAFYLIIKAVIALCRKEKEEAPESPKGAENAPKPSKTGPPPPPPSSKAEGEGDVKPTTPEDEKEIDALTKTYLEQLKNDANTMCDMIFSRKYLKLLDKLDITREQLKRQDSEAWDKLKSKVRKWTAQTYRFRKENQLPTWVTGTRSPALIGIDRAAQTKLGGYVLASTTQLVDHKIVPFTGELENGINPNGVNKRGISGVGFKDCLGAYHYSCRDNFVFEPQEEFNLVLNFDIKERPILRLKIAVLRLLHSGANLAMLEAAKAHIEKQILPLMETQLAVKEILGLFATEKALVFSSQEEQFIASKSSFPLVWGSRSQNLDIEDVKSDYQERLVKGVLTIGSEITFLFTKQKKIPEMQAWLKERNLSVHILSMGALIFLHSLNYTT